MKKEQGSEQFRNCGRKQMQRSTTKKFTKAMMVAWGETSDEEDGSQVEEDELALMARSDPDLDHEPIEESLSI